MAVLLFVAINPKLLPAVWQRYGFYTVALIWAVCIICLLSSLKHVMPPLWQYATEEDFMFTCDLYLWRMGRYNFALIASELCFVSLLVILAPISTHVVDLIFR